MSIRNWQTFSLSDFGLQFQYPHTTPTGHAVEMDDVRVHFRSSDTPELYFEVSRHLRVSAEVFYEREKGFVAERLQDSEVGALTATTLAGQPAQTFSFRWRDGERTVILMEKQDYLYRFIYDPRSQLNLDVLATIKLV